MMDIENILRDIGTASSYRVQMYFILEGLIPFFRSLTSCTY